MEPKSAASGAAVLNEDAIRSLGRKARHRLNEERSKRREIQRLEEHDATPGLLASTTSTTTKNSVSASATNKKRRTAVVVVQPLVKISQKKKRKAVDFGVSDSVVENLSVDRWMPDVSHLGTVTTGRIPLDASAVSGTTRGVTGSSSSSVVQLHGLPVGTTSVPIRRFFSGLDPFRIFILLPLATSLSSRQDRIPELDADYTKPPRKGGLRVERYQNLRVILKFDSAPTAALAVQRSGEILQLTASHAHTHTHAPAHADPATQTQDSQGAAVAVTPVSKSWANYLLKHLVVESDPGVPLEQMVHQIDARLDPMVSPILWDAAIDELHLNVPTSATSPACPLQLRPKDWTRARSLQQRESSSTTCPPLPRNEQQREWIRQWNDYRTQLARQMERLDRPTRLLELDPTLILADPVLSLTVRAVEVLRREMGRVDQAVTVATRWRRLAATRTTAAITTTAKTVY